MSVGKTMAKYMFYEKSKPLYEVLKMQYIAEHDICEEIEFIQRC